MIIKSDLVYSLKDLHQILNIHPRKLNRIARKHNIEKVDNRYIFKGSFILDVFKNEVSKSVETMSQDVKRVSKDVKQYLAEIEALKTEIENLKSQLAIYEIADNERIEVFTNESYELFEKRLKEWHTLQTDIKHQEEIFSLKIKGADERASHYEKQFEYQRKQSERILEMHQQLIDTIEKQNQLAEQRSFIEAKDKKYDE
jgi:hypothetical protein